MIPKYQITFSNHLSGVREDPRSTDFNLHLQARLILTVGHIIALEDSKQPGAKEYVRDLLVKQLYNEMYGEVRKLFYETHGSAMRNCGGIYEAEELKAIERKFDKIIRGEAL